jgi:thiamine transport system substrate-binding protein
MRRTRTASVLATMALTIAACGSDGGSADAPLRLLTHDSFDVSTSVLEQFTAETGIVVEVVPLGDAGSALNRVILTADDPEGDVLFGIDSTFLTRALAAGVLQPYRSPTLEHVDPSLVPTDDRVTPVTFGDVCVNYDIAWFTSAGIEVPRDLASLADPIYAGLLAVQNPATSSPGLAFLLGTIERLGEDGAFSLWERLRANDVLVTDGWSEAYYGAFTHASDGDRPLVVSYASSPPAEVLFAAVPTDTAPTGVILDTCYRQIEYVGILAATERTEDARRLVDFLLSPTFQADVPLTMFVFPARNDVALPEVFTEHAVLPARPLVMDPDRIDAGREAWIARFTATVLR